MAEYTVYTHAHRVQKYYTTMAKSGLRSALACPARCPGPMVVRDPLEVESDWTCQTCHHSQTSGQVTARIGSAKQVRSGVGYFALGRVSLYFHIIKLGLEVNFYFLFGGTFMCFFLHDELRKIWTSLNFFRGKYNEHYINLYTIITILNI